MWVIVGGRALLQYSHDRVDKDDCRQERAVQQPTERAPGERRWTVSGLPIAAPENSDLASERGQGLTEYALIIALVALIVMTALTLMGTKVAAFYNSVGNSLLTP